VIPSYSLKLHKPVTFGSGNYSETDFKKRAFNFDQKHQFIFSFRPMPNNSLFDKNPPGSPLIDPLLELTFFIMHLNQKEQFDGLPEIFYQFCLQNLKITSLSSLGIENFN